MVRKEVPVIVRGRVALSVITKLVGSVRKSMYLAAYSASPALRRRNRTMQKCFDRKVRPTSS
jgi:hypothetical protein